MAGLIHYADPKQQAIIKIANVSKIYPIYENYVYFYHTDTLIWIPVWPESISDSQSANYSGATILGRSAPIQSYGSTQARSITFTIEFHREMLKQTALGGGVDQGIAINGVETDYTDLLINSFYGSVIPNYSSSSKMVDPPMIAARFGNQIYIKGVCTQVNVTYKGALMKDDRYSLVNISFGITETNPYDAITAMGVGGFRSDGEILMNTELNHSTYLIGQNKNSLIP